jgi:hypothetical protein
MHAAVNLCDRILVLEEGQLVFEGSPLKGVEYYTKTSHNRMFKSYAGSLLKNAPVLEDSVGSGIAWVDVPTDSKAGASEIQIMRVAVTSPLNDAIEVVRAHDPIVLHMLIFLTAAKSDLIFGYTVKDRVGNAIFGQNTCESPHKPVSLDKGCHHIRLELKWPDIYPATYLITLGVGEGTHPLHHVIQCWAHNMLSLACVNSGNIIHALFNGPIHGFTIDSAATQCQL